MNPYYRALWRGPRGIGNADPAQQQQPAPAPPPQQVEEESWLVLQRTLTANAAQRDLGIDITKDGDFLLTHVWGTSTGTYNVLIRLFSGRQLSTAPIRNTNLVGTAAFKTPIKPLLYPAGSRLSIDLEDTSGDANTIELIFGGLRILRAR